LSMQLVWLPKQWPELNAMDPGQSHMKSALSNQFAEKVVIPPGTLELQAV
jgi:hypothetical protein